MISESFSFPWQYTGKKKLLKTQQKPLYIMSAMALAYFDILPRALFDNLKVKIICTTQIICSLFVIFPLLIALF